MTDYAPSQFVPETGPAPSSFTPPELNLGRIDTNLRQIDTIQRAWTLPQMPDETRLDLATMPGADSDSLASLLFGLDDDYKRDDEPAQQPLPNPFEAEPLTGIEQSKVILASLSSNPAPERVSDSAVKQFKLRAINRGLLDMRPGQVDSKWSPEFNRIRGEMAFDDYNQRMRGDRPGAVPMSGVMKFVNDIFSPTGLLSIATDLDLWWDFNAVGSEMSSWGDKWRKVGDSHGPFDFAKNLVDALTGPIDDLVFPIVNVGLMFFGVGEIFNAARVGWMGGRALEGAGIFSKLYRYGRSAENLQELGRMSWTAEKLTGLSKGIEAGTGAWKELGLVRRGAVQTGRLLEAWRGVAPVNSGKLLGLTGRIPVRGIKTGVQQGMRLGLAGTLEGAFPGYNSNGVSLSDVPGVAGVRDQLYRMSMAPAFMPLELMFAPYNVFAPGTFFRSGARAFDAGLAARVGLSPEAAAKAGLTELGKGRGLAQRAGRGIANLPGSVPGRTVAGALAGVVGGSIIGEDAGDIAIGAGVGALAGAGLPGVGAGLSRIEEPLTGALIGAGVGAMLGEDTGDTMLGAAMGGLAGAGLHFAPASVRTRFINQTGVHAISRLARGIGQTMVRTNYRLIEADQEIVLGFHRGMQDHLRSLDDGAAKLDQWNADVKASGVIDALAKFQNAGELTNDGRDLAAATITWSYTTASIDWIASTQAAVVQGSAAQFQAQRMARNKIINQLRPIDLNVSDEQIVQDVAKAMAWTEHGGVGADLKTVVKAKQAKLQNLSPARARLLAEQHNDKIGDLLYQLFTQVNFPTEDLLRGQTADIANRFGGDWARWSMRSRGDVLANHVTQIAPTLGSFEKFVGSSDSIRNARLGGLFDDARYKPFIDARGNVIGSKAKPPGKSKQAAAVSAGVQETLLDPATDVTRVKGVSVLAGADEAGRVTVQLADNPTKQELEELWRQLFDVIEAHGDLRRVVEGGKVDWSKIPKQAQSTIRGLAARKWEETLAKVDTGTKVSDLSQSEFDELVKGIAGRHGRESKSVERLLDFARHHKLTLNDLDSYITRTADEMASEERWIKLNMGSIVTDEQGRVLSGVDALSQRVRDLKVKANNTAAEIDLDRLLDDMRAATIEATPTAATPAVLPRQPRPYTPDEIHAGWGGNVRTPTVADEQAAQAVAAQARAAGVTDWEWYAPHKVGANPRRLGPIQLPKGTPAPAGYHLVNATVGPAQLARDLGFGAMGVAGVQGSMKVGTDLWDLGYRTAADVTATGLDPMDIVAAGRRFEDAAAAPPPIPGGVHDYSYLDAGRPTVHDYEIGKDVPGSVAYAKGVYQAIDEFNALPDEAIITVYHGTSKASADALLGTRQIDPALVGTNTGAKVPMPGDLYAIGTYGGAAEYGDTVIAITMRKGDLGISTETALNRENLGESLFNPESGVTIRDPSKWLDAKVVTKGGPKRSALPGPRYTAEQIAQVEALKAGLDADGYKLVHGVEFLMPEDVAFDLPPFEDITRRHLNAITMGNFFGRRSPVEAMVRDDRRRRMAIAKRLAEVGSDVSPEDARVDRALDVLDDWLRTTQEQTRRDMRTAHLESRGKRTLDRVRSSLVPVRLDDIQHKQGLVLDALHKAGFDADEAMAVWKATTEFRNSDFRDVGLYAIEAKLRSQSQVGQVLKTLSGSRYGNELWKRTAGNAVTGAAVGAVAGVASAGQDATFEERLTRAVKGGVIGGVAAGAGTAALNARGTAAALINRAEANRYTYLADGYARLRDSMRFTISPFFDLSRYTEGLFLAQTAAPLRRPGRTVERVVEETRPIVSFDTGGIADLGTAETQAAKAQFDALGDDDLVAVYHGSSHKQAEEIIRTRKVRKGESAGDWVTGDPEGLYVAPTMGDSRVYGPGAIEIIVPKKALRASPEALRVNPSATVGDALFEPMGLGAVLNDIEGVDMRKVTGRYGTALSDKPLPESFPATSKVTRRTVTEQVGGERMVMPLNMSPRGLRTRLRDAMMSADETPLRRQLVADGLHASDEVLDKAAATVKARQIYERRIEEFHNATRLGNDYDADAIDQTGRWFRQVGILGFSPTDWMGTAYAHLRTQGVGTREAYTAAREMYNYGTRGRSAAELSVNFIMFPFSFQKKALTHISKWMMDDIGRAIIIHDALKTYEILDKKYDLDNKWRDHLPYIQKLQQLNLFAYGLSPGRLGGINSQLLEAAGKVGWNMFVPVGANIRDADAGKELIEIKNGHIGGVAGSLLPVWNDINWMIQDTRDIAIPTVAGMLSETATAESANAQARHGYQEWYSFKSALDAELQTRGYRLDDIRTKPWLADVLALYENKEAELSAKYPWWVEAKQEGLSEILANQMERRNRLQQVGLDRAMGLPSTPDNQMLWDFEQMLDGLKNDMRLRMGTSDLQDAPPEVFDAILAQSAANARSNPGWTSLWNKWYRREFGPIEMVMELQ